MFLKFRLPRALLVACAAATTAFAATAAEPDLAGHYYLGDVHEVGSELLLRPDGSFEWMLAYGAMDQQARGRWRREDGRVLLIADHAEAGAKVFARDPVIAWNGEAERRLLDAENDALAEQVLQRCPFLEAAEYASSPALAEANPPSQADLARDAQATLPVLRASIAALEAAARAVAEHPADGAAKETARQAMDRYLGAQAAARDAHASAGLDTAQLPEPRYPPACQLPEPVSDEPPASAWRGGYGVLVGDPEAGLRFSGIRVAFEFADGSRVQAETDRGGWAGVRRSPAALRGVTLALRDEAHPAETFAIAGMGDQVFPFRIDSRSLAPAPFRQMELRVEGDALVPTWPDGDERGRYERQR